MRGIFLAAGLILAACGGEPRPAEDAAGPPGTSSTPALRLVVEATPGTAEDEVTRRVLAVLGGGARVEPLFDLAPGESDPERLGRFFLVVTPVSAGEGPWDTAYRLRERGGFTRVEPDVARPVFEPESAAARGACFLPDDPRVTDHGWSGRLIRVRAAWALEPRPGGARFGEGILIGHPDTGWTEHDDLDRLELSLQRNIMAGTNDARDPLGSGNPGHGTATGSVIASGGDLIDPPVSGEGGTAPPGRITGIAPRARLIPIRAIQSVVQIFDSDVARAVRHATRSGAHVVSMSLGGTALRGLEAAINDAVHRDVLVVAAAGNCVGFVVAPAAFENCIGVAAVNRDRRPWRGSSRGRAVRISAPGEHVWCARAGAGRAAVSRGQGTSFAVANVAGAAALWLAHHNRDHLLAHYRDGAHLQDVFARVLQESAQPGVDLDPSRFGPGILDAAALLQEPLPADLRAGAARRVSLLRSSELAVMERVLDLDRTVLQRRLGVLLAAAPGTEDEAIERFGPELLQIFLERPESFAALAATDVSGATARAAGARIARTAVLPSASQALRAALEGGNRRNP